MIRLEDFGTGRDQFVAVMLALKAVDEVAYQAMLSLMRALVGTVKLDAAQRAALVETHREIWPTYPVDWIETALAMRGAS